MKFIYPAKFYKEAEGYWVDFPDLEGCQTYGDTIEDTIANASEALELYLESLLENEISFNKPSSVESLTGDCDLVNYIYCDIDIAKFSKSVKKTLTIPAWLNKQAVEQGINFSKVLQEALYKKVI